LRTVSAFSILV